MKYSANETIWLSKVKFEAEEKQFFAKTGVLKWSPEVGFSLEASLDPSGIRTRSVKAGTSVSLGRPVYMQPTYMPNRKMSAPNVSVQHKYSTGPLGGDWLSLKFERLLYRERYETEASDEWECLALYRYEGESLPDRVDQTTNIAGCAIRPNWTQTGFRYEVPGSYKLVGKMRNERHLDLHWRLDAKKWSSGDCWFWGEAISSAFAILTGHEARILKRSMASHGQQWGEKVADKPPLSMGVWSMFGSPQGFDKENFCKLVEFLVSNRKMGRACSAFLRRMFLVAKAGHREVAELMLSTLLEGLLRTIQNEPFDPAVRGYDVGRKLTEFRKQYLDASWEDHCRQALACRKRLRNRNAHPDWLFHTRKQEVSERIQEATSDMQFLSRFYGYMLLAVAGVETKNPKFPSVVELV